MATPSDDDHEPATATWKNRATGKTHIVVAAPEKPGKKAIGVRPIEPKGGWSATPIPGTIWTDFELDYMSLNLPLYRERKGEERKKLLMWVRGKIHTQYGDKYNEQALKQKALLKEWRRRKNSIGDWFRNHGRTNTEIKIPHWRGRISFHAVMQIKKREQIADLTDELSGGAQRGSIDGKWIAFYQRATAQIKAGLTDAERQDIRRTQKTWDNKSLPEAEQARLAATRGGKTLQKVHESLFRTMGLRCVTFCTYYDQAGLPVNSIVDINDKLVKEGCGRVRSFRSWNEQNPPKIADAWVDYIDNMIVPVEKPEQVAEELRKKVGAPKPAIIIKELDGGHILVPDSHECENQADRTYIIRHFVNAEYRLARGGVGRSAPWLAISTEPSIFVEAECIPEDVRLRDPEKMSGPDRTNLLEHWRRRQALGRPALVFKAVATNGKVQSPSYPANMCMPPVTECAPVHTPLPAIGGDTDADSGLELNEAELQEFALDRESSISSGRSDIGLPTPAATSLVPEQESPPKRKRGRPKKAPAPEPTKGVTTTKRPRGRPKKNLRVESSPEAETPPPEQSMLTPDGTPAPQTKSKPRPKPKPVTQRKRGALERELRTLGIQIPESSGRVLRSSPLKPNAT